MVFTVPYASSYSTVTYASSNSNGKIEHKTPLRQSHTACVVCAGKAEMLWLLYGCRAAWCLAAALHAVTKTLTKRMKPVHVFLSVI